MANNGAAPIVPGFGGQSSNGHRHRHHRHHKSKHGHVAATPMSRDESIHKVVHGQNQYAQPNQDVQYAGGFGVPYGTVGYGATGANFGGLYQLQQQYPASNFGYTANQFQNNPFGTVGKRHRRHHHHHRHQANEILAGAAAPLDQAQAMPEQAIGQRSTSAFAGRVDGQQNIDLASPKKLHRHHHHHHDYRQESIEQKVSKPSRRSRRTESKHGHTSVGGDGYGHLNGDLIFIERGDQSPHRQEPPSGYEYKGKIEVQCNEEVTRSRSRGRVVPPQPLPQPAPVPQTGPCPPGWQQVMVPATGVSFPTGATGFSGQGAGFGTIGQTGLGGFSGGLGGFTGGFGGMGLSGAGAIGTAGTGGFGTYGGTSQGQLIADYVIEAGGTGGQSQYHHEGGSEGRVTTRTKIIEVWQKRSKSQGGGEQRREKSDSSDSSDEVKQTGPSFDFERFRKEVLSAIERITQSTGGKYTFTSHEGGTQTQIRPSPHEGGSTHEVRPAPSGGGEVRVIVQPIQPVFYMPRQTEGPAPVPSQQTHVPQYLPGPAPAPAPAPSASPKIVYVPRNVYVPVIKPVFVPRERIIVRPQVIHVARPVLVDRPVPVTQRPIIIDRERPIPVPVRTAGQAAAESGGSSVVREEYVYRDNLPVAYGGRCAEYAGGVNYGYMPTQQEHQYATSSVHEESVGYQNAGPVIDVPAPAAYEQTQSFEQANYQQSYVDTAQTNNFAAGGSGSLSCSGIIEVLDTTKNSSWQRTDQSSLANQYGRTALDIVQTTGQGQQQMFQQMHQSNSGGGVYRSGSAATFGSASGFQLGPRGHSFSSIPLGDINPFNPEGIPHHGPAPIPVRINY